jgi:hypothetical protein
VRRRASDTISGVTTSRQSTVGSASTRLALLTAVAAIGALDTGIFIATDPQTALKTSGRATGSLAGLAVWVLLLALSARRWRGSDGNRLATAGLVLATLAALDGVGLAAIHTLAGVGGARTLIGGAAGVAVLCLAVAARKPAR